ncbi:MAG: hypothetical protein ACXW0Z_15565 [Gemmatirosa sp.]
MNRALAALLAAGALAGCPAIVAAQASTRPLLRGQGLDADGAVRIWNLVGSVRVIAWAHDSLAVSARGADGGQLHFGGGRRGVKLGVEERGGSAVSADLEVRVPRRARVWVKSSTASVTVSGLVGDVELYTVTGGVRVAGRPSTLRVESLAGPVTVSDGADWLRARTSSGAIDVRGAVGDASLATVGGTLALDGPVAQRARLESVTGGVRQRGAVARGATLAIETNSGDVTLHLAREGAALDLLTLNGRITSPVAAVRDAVRATKQGHQLLLPAEKGAGADLGRIEVRSFRGAIVVERASQ